MPRSADYMIAAAQVRGRRGPRCGQLDDVLTAGQLDDVGRMLAAGVGAEPTWRWLRDDCGLGAKVSRRMVQEYASRADG